MGKKKFTTVFRILSAGAVASWRAQTTPWFWHNRERVGMPLIRSTAINFRLAGSIKMGNTRFEFLTLCRYRICTLYRYIYRYLYHRMPRYWFRGVLSSVLKIIMIMIIKIIIKKLNAEQKKKKNRKPKFKRNTSLENPLTVILILIV